MYGHVLAERVDAGSKGSAVLANKLPRVHGTQTEALVLSSNTAQQPGSNLSTKESTLGDSAAGVTATRATLENALILLCPEGDEEASSGVRVSMVCRIRHSPSDEIREGLIYPSIRHVDAVERVAVLIHVSREQGHHVVAQTICHACGRQPNG